MLLALFPAALYRWSYPIPRCRQTIDKSVYSLADWEWSLEQTGVKPPDDLPLAAWYKYLVAHTLTSFLLDQLLYHIISEIPTALCRHVN